jgi:hypothetical protein
MPVFYQRFFHRKKPVSSGFSAAHSCGFPPKTEGYSLGFIRLKKAEKQSKIKQGRVEGCSLYNVRKDVR